MNHIPQHYPLLLLPQAKFLADYGIHWCFYCSVWFSHISNILRGLDPSLPNIINLMETISADANRTCLCRNKLQNIHVTAYFKHGAVWRKSKEWVFKSQS